MKKMITSMTILAIALGLAAVPVWAYFTHSVRITNNTFASGTAALRLFYDCRTPSDVGDVQEQTFGMDADSAIVECQIDGDGSDETTLPPQRKALVYSTSDGGTMSYRTEGDLFNLEQDWTSLNGWWGGLSSAMDHTLIYPGWGSDSAMIDESTDVLSVGNSGSVPLTLFVTMQLEAFDEDEVAEATVIEPQDGFSGTPTGGDRVDPYLDTDWLTTHAYDPHLADKLHVRIERLNGFGEVQPGATYEDVLSSLIDQPLTLLVVQPNEVALVKFSWWWDQVGTPEDVQNRFFDYRTVFTGQQVGVSDPVGLAPMWPDFVPVTH